MSHVLDVAPSDAEDCAVEVAVRVRPFNKR